MGLAAMFFADAPQATKTPALADAHSCAAPEWRASGGSSSWFSPVVLALAIGLGAAAAWAPTAAFAQAAGERSDASLDADDARTQAILGMPGTATPEPFDNLYSTAPGAESQVARPALRLNLLAPLNYDSNANALQSGGSQSWGTFPVANLSAAAPVGDLPFRFSVSANSEFKRFFDLPSADVDRIAFSGRIQYVDPTNDQALSPYFAITPRFSYVPTLSDLTERRQDFNLGFNKRFNFDGSFQPLPVAANTSAATVWSVGLTAFVQRRLREPQLSSDAAFLIPSVSWTISESWNASLAVELLGRWYDADRFGQTSRDLEALPIATVEYVLPPTLFGSESLSRILGRPVIDLQGSHLNVWSSTPGVSYGQWEASATVKMGWSF